MEKELIEKLTLVKQDMEMFLNNDKLDFITIDVDELNATLKSVNRALHIATESYLKVLESLKQA